MKHRAVSVRQLSFLLIRLDSTVTVSQVKLHFKPERIHLIMLLITTFCDIDVLAIVGHCSSAVSLDT